MLKHLLLILALGMVGISCSKKKTADGIGDSTGDSSISGEEMTFDAAGSDSGTISGLTTVNFEFDSSSLSSSSRKKLQDNADWIKGHPNHVVQVEGHCDSRGSIEYNLALGERRAKAVKNYLVGLGIDPRGLTIISYGEEKPLASGENEAAWAKNRRANFLPISR